MIRVLKLASMLILRLIGYVLIGSEVENLIFVRNIQASRMCSTISDNAYSSVSDVVQVSRMLAV